MLKRQKLKDPQILDQGFGLESSSVCPSGCVTGVWIVQGSIWGCGRVVECNGLEHRQGFAPLVSSNLTASAALIGWTQPRSKHPRSREPGRNRREIQRGKQGGVRVLKIGTLIHHGVANATLDPKCLSRQRS